MKTPPNQWHVVVYSEDPSEYEPVEDIWDWDILAECAFPTNEEQLERIKAKGAISGAIPWA